MGVVCGNEQCVGYLHSRYVKGLVMEKERRLIMADYFEGRDWAKMAAGKEFVFFKVGGRGVHVLMCGTSYVGILFVGVVRSQRMSLGTEASM